MEISAALAAFILTALLGLSFLCALAEASLLSLGRWQVQGLATGGGKASRAAWWLDHPEDLVSTLSLANTLANGLFVVTSLVLARQFEWNMAGALVAAFTAVLAGGEILPKALAVRAPERWAVWTVPAVDLLGWVTLPVRRIAQWAIEKVLGWLVPTSLKNAPITDEEYRELLDMAVQQGALGHSEREIIAELITLDRKCARDVMRPRATMAAVPDDLSVEDLAKEVRRLRHRRLPMYDETPDTIVGVLNARLFLLDPEHGLDEAIEFPSFVPETMNLLKLFQALQRQNRSLAIVLDEFGAVAGVVRMEDILGEVLGDMTGDPATRGFVFEKLGPGRWRVSGSMRLEDFRREHPSLPAVTEVETLGGLLTAQLDIIPGVGQSAVIHGLRLTVDQADERHVHVLVVEVADRR